MKGSVRYVDDVALYHDDPEHFGEWRPRISEFLECRRLRLHPRKTWCAPTSEPAVFLGLVLLPGGRWRLPDENVRRFRNRLRSLRARWRHGTVDRKEVERRIEAWIAHAEHAHTGRLRQAIFRGGWFDPLRRLGRLPEGAFSAAAPGTTNRGPSAPDRNNNNGFRVARMLESLSRRPQGGRRARERAFRGGHAEQRAGASLALPVRGIGAGSASASQPIPCQAHPQRLISIAEK